MIDEELDRCPSNERAAAWVLRALKPDEERVFRAHLTQCASCRGVVRDTEQLTALLGASIEQVDPPARLRDALLAGAARTPQVQHREEQPHPAEAVAPSGDGRRRHASSGRVTALAPRRQGWRGVRLVAAVATAAVLGLGALMTYTTQISGQRAVEAAQVARLSEIIVRSQQPESVNVTLSGEGQPVAAVMVVDGRLTLVSTGLARNPEATTYVLWGLGGSAPQPLAPFDVVDEAAGPRWAGPATGEFSGYAVSLEPGRTMPAAPTSVLAAGQRR